MYKNQFRSEMSKIICYFCRFTKISIYDEQIRLPVYPEIIIYKIRICLEVILIHYSEHSTCIEMITET